MTSVARLAVPVFLLSLVLTVYGGGAARAEDAYTDAKLQSYVMAAIQVGALMREYKPRVDAAGSPRRADALRAEAKAKMDAAITETAGITIDEYIEILLAARSDTGLHNRIDTLYRAAKGR